MSEAIDIYLDGQNPLRFYASSRARPEIRHQVDLGAWEGNGSCTCEHFEFRLRPRLRERRLLNKTAARTAANSTRCSHILAARRAFTDTMIARIRQALPQAATTADDES